MSETAIVSELCDLSLIDPKPNTNQMASNTQELLKSIKLVGYQETLLSENELSNALEEGPKSVEYTKLISFFTKEIKELCNIDECVNAITAPEDSNTFIMETSSFLNELGCPHESLVQGHVSDRLSTVADRVLLIQYLIGELMAARIIRENQPEKRMDLKLKESSQASDLRKILQILGFSQPPKNITMQLLLQKVTSSLKNLLARADKNLINDPIFNWTLSANQWEALTKVDQDLHDEYFIRREMLLKRLDCTIQSFQWSDRTKGKDNIFQQTYSEKRKCLKTEPDVDISDLLASRADVAIIEKTSSASVRKHTKSSVNRVIIGAVPDRGGRTSEQAPPPPEMPPWQQRNAGPSGGFGGRGGFNQSGSNFSRGGGNSFSQGSNYGNSFSNSSSFNRGGSSYNKDGGSSNYSQGNSYGNNYSDKGGSNYNKVGSAGGNSYSQGSYNSYSGSKGVGSFDSAGSYGGKSDYSQGSTDYSKTRGDDSSRSYSQGYSRDSNSRYSRDSSSGYSQSSGSYSQGGYTKPFDSAGSYGGYSQDYQEPKRAKTYDQFQQNRSTYADQYVQESQHNQQYQSRDHDNRNKGRGGRSNYNRGGGGGSSYR